MKNAGVEPEGDESVYTLSEIVARLGAASEAEARQELEGFHDGDLIGFGRKIGTPRLAKELARNYGTFAEWQTGATAEQLALLGFVGPGWLRVAAWAGRQAEQRYQAREAGQQGNAASKQVRETAAETLEVAAVRSRNRLRTMLMYLAGGLPVWVTKINTAYAVSATSVPVADSLAALASVGAEMLKDKSPGMTARLAKTALTKASLDKHKESAAALAKAVKAAGAVKSASPITQSEVDLWDGIAITLFEQFVEAVEDAREDDPTIPAPSIIGLRGWFRRLSRKKVSAPGEADAAKGGEKGGEKGGDGVAASGSGKGAAGNPAATTPA